MPYFCKSHASRTAPLSEGRSPVPERLPGPPAHDEIERLAYRYWEDRGREGGSPLEDWFRAERQLSGTRGA